MPQAARIHDPIGHGSATGTIIGPCSPNVLTNGPNKARIGDLVFCAFHPNVQPNVIVSGSLTVLVNGPGAARVGDLTTCGATILAGSPNVIVGD